jgi:hypothetical protein
MEIVEVVVVRQALFTLSNHEFVEPCMTTSRSRPGMHEIEDGGDRLRGDDPMEEDG